MTEVIVVTVLCIAGLFANRILYFFTGKTRQYYVRLNYILDKKNARIRKKNEEILQRINKRLGKI